MTANQPSRRHEGIARAPLKPRPDNVTSPARTPWGGRHIYGTLKAGLPGIPPPGQAPIVGESFEISDDPALPSRFLVQSSGRLREVTLSELAPSEMREVIGADIADETGGRIPLLIKLIDSADNLSVQVHPPRDDPRLATGESGKSEAWVVIDCAPGAGLYLGLAEGVTRAKLAAMARSGADLRPLLNFVPITPGQTFKVPPGTVHAIGRGCTLFEIQRFSPPSSAATYRLWDWNRLFDERGRPSPIGRPRKLHLDHALEVIDFAAPRGAAALAQLEATPRTLRVLGESHELALIDNLDGLELRRLHLAPGSPLTLETSGRFALLTCLSGRLTLSHGDGEISPLAASCFRMGESLLLPAALESVTLSANTPSDLLLGRLTAGTTL